MAATPADTTRASGSALAVSRQRCWTRTRVRAATRVTHTSWTRSGTLGFLGPLWPGAGSRHRFPRFDPDGWLVRMLKANGSENPAAELITRAVKSLSRNIGELPLPWADPYPLTRSLLMGGTYSAPIRHLFGTYSPIRFSKRPRRKLRELHLNHQEPPRRPSHDELGTLSALPIRIES